MLAGLGRLTWYRVSSSTPAKRSNSARTARGRSVAGISPASESAAATGVPRARTAAPSSGEPSSAASTCPVTVNRGLAVNATSWTVVASVTITTSGIEAEK